MTGRRRNTPKTIGEHRTQLADAPSALDFGTWARRLLTKKAEALSDEERAELEAQMLSLTALPVPLPPDRTAPSIVRDRKGLELLAKQLKEATEIVIDLETSGLDPRKGEIVGVGLSTQDGNYYIPTAHRLKESNSLRPDQLAIRVVAKELCLDRLALVAHNGKFEFRWLRCLAGVTCNFAWDVMLAARLLASHLPADLKSLAARELEVADWGLSKQEIENVQFLPIDRVARYCAKDCYYTLELYRRQRACLV